MSYVYLAELRPGLATTGAEQVLRYSSDPRWTRADGVDWLPTLAVPLRRNTQVFDGAFQEQPQEYGSLEVAISRGHPTTPLTAMVWDGRPVKIWRGQVGQNTAAMTVVFDGTAQDVGGTKKRYQVSLRGPNLDGVVLKAAYAGSGAAEGTADLRNVLKPLLLGTATNLEPVYVDRSRGIFQYHGYGAAGGVQAVYDSGSQLGAVTQDYATYALLDAAVVPAGRFATCNALGMGRHGGEITGVLTIDATGAVASGLPGSILKWLTLTHAGVPAGRVKSDSLDWLDAQLPYAQDIYVTDQVTVEQLARDLMLKLGGYVWFTDDGRFTVGLVRRGGAATTTLDRLNIAEGTSFRPTAAPVWMRRQGYRRSWRKHSFTEVRTPREITPRGAFVGGTAYQYYDLVEYGPSSYVYVASVAGNAAVPGTDPAVWTLFQNNGAAVVDSPLQPAAPVQGMLWRNSTTGMLWWYNAGAWVAVANVGSTVGSDLRAADGTTVLTETGTTGVRNNAMSLSAAGALLGGAGGQATLPGMGYVGSLNATADITLVPLSPANMLVRGNSIKGTSVGVWQAFYSRDPFRSGAVVSFRVDMTGAVKFAGLRNAVPAANTSDAALGFSWYFNGDPTNLHILLPNGSVIGNAATAVTSTDVFSVAVNNVSVFFLRNGVVLAAHTQALSAWSMAANSAWRVAGGAQGDPGENYLRDISLSPATDALWANLGLVPSNLAALTGSEGINNALTSLSASGAYMGGGGGQLMYDSLANGSVYGKLRLTALVADGRRIAAQRALPPISSMNLGYKFTGSITFSAAAGSPATATISVGAGSALIGESPPAYSASSAGVTGTGGTTVNFHLYYEEVDDPTGWGGTRTLYATTDGNAIYGSSNRVWLGTCPVAFPASGTGGGSGGGGGGGGGGWTGPLP